MLFPRRRMLQSWPSVLQQIRSVVWTLRCDLEDAVSSPSDSNTVSSVIGF